MAQCEEDVVLTRGKRKGGILPSLSGIRMVTENGIDNTGCLHALLFIAVNKYSS